MVCCRGSVPRPSHGIFVKNADRYRVVAMVVEFGRIMQHQNRHVTTSQPLPRSLKVPLQNLSFAYPRVGKEAIESCSIVSEISCSTAHR
jgi:hypothetical protein